jgi:hypothetical protein
MSIKNIYRISPVLWNDSVCKQATTIYGIDRAPTSNLFPTACSSRVREDPAYYWDNATFQRLVPPSGIALPNCYGPASQNGITWVTLPAWLSYVQTLGYVVKSDLSTLKPFSDIYIEGP